MYYIKCKTPKGGGKKLENSQIKDRLFTKERRF